MKERRDKKEQKGFTLIELLVVVAIIGILTSVVLASINSAKIKGRITKRISDLQQMQNALELFYNQNGAYPINASGSCNCTNSACGNPGDCAWTSQCTGLVGYGGVAPGAITVGLIPNYISALPKGPMTDNVNVDCYAYKSSGKDYKLMDFNILEMTVTDLQKYATFKDPTRSYASPACPFTDSTITMAIYSPGAACW